MDCWDYAEVCGRYGTKIKCIGSRMGDSLLESGGMGSR